MSDKPEIKVDVMARVRVWLGQSELQDESTVDLVKWAGEQERGVLISQLYACTLSALSRREGTMKMDWDVSAEDLEGLQSMADHLIEQYHESVIKVHDDQYSSCCGKPIEELGDGSMMCQKCGDETKAVIYE